MLLQLLNVIIDAEATRKPTRSATYLPFAVSVFKSLDHTFARATHRARFQHVHSPLKDNVVISRRVLLRSAELDCYSR